MGNPFRILSLDGGGIRGAFGVAFLAEIERITGHPISDHFDLIAGTSTGGIAATALALGERAARVEALFEELGEKVFVRSRIRRAGWLLRAVARLARSRLGEVDAEWLAGSKYESDALRSAISNVLGERTLEHAQRRLVVPAIDLTRAQTVVFKTPHLPDLVRDRRVRAADVVMATAAAPTYFPYSSISQGGHYADGGLWANNPAAVAYAEACQIREKCKRPEVDKLFDREDISVLSVGTGSPKYNVDLPEPGRDGLLYWGPRLLDVIGTSHSQGTGFLCQYLLGPRYVRIDFDVPDNMWRLDRVDVLAELLHLGREAATAKLAQIRKPFLDYRAPPFIAFPH